MAPLIPFRILFSSFSSSEMRQPREGSKTERFFHNKAAGDADGVSRFRRSMGRIALGRQDVTVIFVGIYWQRCETTTRAVVEYFPLNNHEHEKNVSYSCSCSSMFREWWCWKLVDLWSLVIHVLWSGSVAWLLKLGYLQSLHWFSAIYVENDN